MVAVLLLVVVVEVEWLCWVWLGVRRVHKTAWLDGNTNNRNNKKGSTSGVEGEKKAGSIKECREQKTVDVEAKESVRPATCTGLPSNREVLGRWGVGGRREWTINERPRSKAEQSERKAREGRVEREM
jgi:hypothetical protein